MGVACTERFREALNREGLRLTPQRQAVLTSLHQLPPPVTADQVFRKASALRPGVRLSTVYRTLELLQRLGLVALVEKGPRGNLYVHDASETPHLHLHCRHCGTTCKVDFDEIRILLDDFESRFGFRLEVDGNSLVGRCSQCR